MRDFFKVTIKNTFSNNIFWGVFGWLFLGLIIEFIADLIHHSQVDLVQLLILPAFALLIIIYLIKYIVECIKYFNHTSQSIYNGNSNKSMTGVILNFSLIVFIMLALLFLKMNQTLLFLVSSLIGVLLKVILLVKDR